MTDIERAYMAGMIGTFVANGVEKTAAHAISGMKVGLEKKASMFNFSDNPYGGGGISLSSILIPLLAASAAGYVGYNAGLNGSKNKSAFSNVKNYLGGTLDKVVRKNKSPALFNFVD